MVLIYTSIIIPVITILAITTLFIARKEKKEITKGGESEKKKLKKIEKYNEDIEKIKNNNKEERKIIDSIDKLAREFFKDFYPEMGKLSYSHLIDKYKEKRKDKYIYCDTLH